MSFLSRPSRDHCFHRPIKISTGRVFQILRARSIQPKFAVQNQTVDNLLSFFQEIPGIFCSIGHTISTYLVCVYVVGAALLKFRKRKENKSSSVHVLHKTLNGDYTSLFCRGRQRKCTKLYNARAEPVFCQLKLLFSDVLVVVVVVSAGPNDNEKVT